MVSGSVLSAIKVILEGTKTEKAPMNIIAQYTPIRVTPIRDTLLAPYNLVLVAATLVLLPMMFRWMMPRGAQIRPLEPARLAEPAPPEVVTAPPEKTPAWRLEQSRLVTLALAALAAAYLLRHFAQRGFALDLNVVILTFFLLGLLLHQRPIHYVLAFNQAARVAGPLALQYPLYGGIMGLMESSGLARVIAHLFVSFSTPTTFPFYTFLSSIIITLFIPSGGGHWVVQGPFMIPAATRLGVSPTVTAMAVAFGEQTGNMVQPFWALPILAIAGLGIRDIMGYCVMTFLLSSLLSTAVLFLLT